MENTTTISSYIPKVYHIIPTSKISVNNKIITELTTRLRNVLIINVQFERFVE